MSYRQRSQTSRLPSALAGRLSGALEQGLCVEAGWSRCDLPIPMRQASTGFDTSLRGVHRLMFLDLLLPKPLLSRGVALKASLSSGHSGLVTCRDRCLTLLL